MKIRGTLSQMLKKCLYESLNADMLERVARDVIADYDLRGRTGFPPNIPFKARPPLPASSTMSSRRTCSSTSSSAWPCSTERASWVAPIGSAACARSSRP